MGRPKRFTPEELEKKWKEYKIWCDSLTVERTEFSPKSESFITGAKRAYVTYTIEGFCVYCDMARSTFYAHYDGNKRYVDIVTRIREACEVDARIKFETEQIPSKLAGMWMSKYGYSEKQEIDTNADVNLMQIDFGGGDEELAK